MNDKKISDADTAKIAAVVEEETRRLEVGLTGLISDARGKEGPAKVAAVKKLKIFGSVTDPVLATKLALMSRAQRQAYIGRRKKAAGKIRARAIGGAGKKKERRAK